MPKQSAVLCDDNDISAPSRLNISQPVSRVLNYQWVFLIYFNVNTTKMFFYHYMCCVTDTLAFYFGRLYVLRVMGEKVLKALCPSCVYVVDRIYIP